MGCWQRWHHAVLGVTQGMSPQGPRAGAFGNFPDRMGRREPGDHKRKSKIQVKLSKWWHLPVGYSGGPLPPPDPPLLSFPQGKRYKTSLETVGTPDSSRGRSEKKTIK